MKKYISLLLLLFLIPLTATAQFSGTVTSVYGWRTHPIFGIGHGHSGVDIAAPQGVALESLTSGVVVYSGWVGGYGWFISIKDSSGVYWNYGHNSMLLLSEGDRVTEGQPIALVGSTGNSTGPHVHIERRIGGTFGNTTDPLPYIQSKWSLDGYNGTGEFPNSPDFKVIPSIDFDYSGYFSPNEEVMRMGKNILTALTAAISFAQKNLIDLLLILFTLELAWFAIQSALNASLDINELIPRFIRYGFFLFLFSSWNIIVSEFFVPMIEQITSTATGKEFSQNEFLKFDELFISVATMIKPFLHIDDSMSSFTQIIAFISVPFILAITILLSFYIMYKLLNFYLMCVFGALGLPLMIFKVSERYGKNLLSSILVSAFDLILSIWLYLVFISGIESCQIIDGDSIAMLLCFTIIYTILAGLLPNLSNSMTGKLQGILN